MPREKRERAVSGIYHVMVRGINKQLIFEDKRDYRKMIAVLRDLLFPKDGKGKASTPPCILYAYCLMPNRIHLLLREKEESVSDFVKRLNESYVIYYNRKYQRIGHLFQNRFRSETVEDMGYFCTLLRYIHQNPVKSGLTKRAEKYIWSSWREYLYDDQQSICDRVTVLSRISKAELVAWVNDLLDDEVECIDIESENKRTRKRMHKIDNEYVKDILRYFSGAETVTEFQGLSRDEQRAAMSEALARGASERQLQHLTGLTNYQVRLSRSLG